MGRTILILLMALAACGPAGRPIELPVSSRLVPDDAGPNLHAGIAVALSGARAAVGASGASDQGLRSGAVYVYRRSGSGWRQDEKLTPSRGEADNRFGSDVALDGDILAAAARGAAIDGRRSGSVHLYRETDSLFVEIAAFTSDLRNDRFGASVHLSGGRLAVGAPGDARYGIDAGAVHIYRETSEGWVHEQRLHPHEPSPRARFGASLALDGARLAVGAPGDDENGTGSGAVHLFRLTEGRAVPGIVLRSPNPSADGSFGACVDIDGERLVVGAPMEDGWLRDIGYVYVYGEQGGGWVQEAELTVGALEGGTFFGNAVSLSGSRLLVGARGHDVADWESGSAHLFRRTSEGWEAEAFLWPEAGVRNGAFGRSVALDGRLGFIGSNGSRARGAWSGAVYYF